MFKEQLVRPYDFNKYYIAAPNGYSPCILGNEKHRDRTLNVLPNCVGWAVGRFNEIAHTYGDLKAGVCKYLGSWNAKDFVRYSKAQGLESGSIPKLGAAVCWSGGSGYGHVGIIEHVYSDGSFLMSESGWSATRAMWTAVHKKGKDGNWLEGGDTWMRNGSYRFEGFIYQPKEIFEMTQEEFNKMMENYLDSRADLKASKYAEDALSWAKKNKIMTGDEKGNLMPKSFITREDTVVLLKRIYDMTV